MCLRPIKNWVNKANENDLDSHAKTEGIEFQSNYDCDYKLFFENMRLEGSNVIYQYKNGASVIYDGLIFLNSQKDNNVVSKKRKYTDTIQHETTSKGSKDVNNHCGNPPQIMCSNFKVKILEILHKLYDKEEHERLMQKILSGSLNISIEICTLEGKIEEAVAANNDLKQLNLLRGFFFWLQDFSLIAWNITDDESFILWNDKECIDNLHMEDDWTQLLLHTLITITNQ
ncbi:hypothetical protein M9H77_11565 [Catharanthus roseus]|uniref:Uncharacterized protein n=1 Tax=Catharanthus roseus TaxID=4058 RepID=A0ACC0BEZ9_CATRO|nr:hypothetical protein M9H77_11565 [Catharanthus roseus]